MISYLDIFMKLFPAKLFPWIILPISALLQNIAWFSSHIFTKKYNLFTRVVISWFIAFGEYSFLIPGLNISTHLLQYSHISSIVMLHSFQLIFYVFLNKIYIKEDLNYKKYIALLLIIFAIILVNIK